MLSVCEDCIHYHSYDGKYAESNGDPGYPPSTDCDWNWECPFEEADDEYTV